ncbi:BspA family leucine-rich repeat surface protein [Francisella sciaenopsi]|uniref:BspA family leucine-rich repeat surface protein n=1 Tax=Francisella sciaenopsi TaxID=3055034 RepID=A0ABQ6PCK9_9GAMM
MKFSKVLFYLFTISSVTSLTSCESIKDAYQTYYKNIGSSDITSKSTYTCSKYEVGSVIKNSFGNSYTLVVGNISIRDGYVINLLTKNISFNYENHNINHVCTSHVTDMSYLFDGAEEISSNITDFDTSKVKNMSYMFANTRNFNQPIGSWDTSKVENMDHMFYRARGFNQPIGNWKVFNVKNMDYMFAGAYKFNQPINGWNVLNVLDYSHFISATSALNPQYKPNFVVYDFSIGLKK